MMRNPQLTIVAPTRNEAENAVPFLDRVRKALARSASYEVLIVDDSDDATPHVVSGVMKQDERVRMIHRTPEKRNGLAGAFVAGFAEARGEFVCCLDADLQHPPEVIPLLLGCIEGGNDIAVASRYAHGGSTKGLAGILRRLSSRMARMLAFALLPAARATSDPGSGFFMFRKSALDGVRLRPRGFKILIELLARARYRMVGDVPFKFLPRTRAQSKMSMREAFEFLLHIVSLRTEVQRAWYRMIAAMLFIGVTLGVIGARVIFSPDPLVPGIAALSLLLSLQGILSLIFMLYAWEDPHAVRAHQSPDAFNAPRMSFTALLPARHEEKVIGDTIRAIARIRYPEHMKELLVLCRADDQATIAAAERTLAKLGNPRARMVVFHGGPVNKPHGLNMGMRHATGDVVTVFDAEDEPHEDIYNIVNTVMKDKDADVVQSGVQLMNFRSHWFSALNVLEYFFWYKSSLLFFSRLGFMPLGGNTAFMKRAWIERVGGWDLACLTEDADIGMRLSAAGAKTEVIYDARHATREETPPDVGSFIRQRTRWNQGFLQVLKKGVWLKLPTLAQIMLAGYTLLWPEIQALLFLYVPVACYTMLTVKAPVGVALLSAIPLFLFFFELLVNMVGLVEFARAYRLRLPWRTVAAVPFMFIPFQFLLGLSAFRAAFRFARRDGSWEKTEHANAHRQVTPAPAY